MIHVEKRVQSQRSRQRKELVIKIQVKIRMQSAQRFRQKAGSRPHEDADREQELVYSKIQVQSAGKGLVHSDIQVGNKAHFPQISMQSAGSSSFEYTGESRAQFRSTSRQRAGLSSLRQPGREKAQFAQISSYRPGLSQLIYPGRSRAYFIQISRQRAGTSSLGYPCRQKGPVHSDIKLHSRAIDHSDIQKPGHSPLRFPGREKGLVHSNIQVQNRFQLAQIQRPTFLYIQVENSAQLTQLSNTRSGPIFCLGREQCLVNPVIKVEVRAYSSLRYPRREQNLVHQISRQEEGPSLLRYPGTQQRLVH